LGFLFELSKACFDRIQTKSPFAANAATGFTHGLLLQQARGAAGDSILVHFRQNKGKLHGLLLQQARGVNQKPV
jgi:hypothetical protein